MANTIIYSDYNGFPGSDETYDFGSGEQSPIFPDVTLYNSFNYTLKSTGADARDSPTEVDNTDSPLDDTDTTSGGRKPTRSGQSTSPRYGYSSVFVIKVPTAMRWVVDQGPDGDGAAQNEKGDWFSEEVLGKADRFGPGIRLDTVERTGTETLYYVQEDTARGTSTAQYTADAWNYLKISGAYNASVFPYNEFAYTDEYPSKENDYGTGGGEVDSIYELPGKFNALHKFIPDDREKTTLTFKVEVDWIRVFLNSGLGQYMSQPQKDSVLSGFDGKGVTASGTDTHTVTHVVINDTSNWKALLEETLTKQYTTEEQWKNGGQDFPFREFDLKTAETVEGSESTPFLDNIKDSTARAVATGSSGDNSINVTTTTSGTIRTGDLVFGDGIGDGATVERIVRRFKGNKLIGATSNVVGIIQVNSATAELFSAELGVHKVFDNNGAVIELDPGAFVVSDNRETIVVNLGPDYSLINVTLRAKIFSKAPQSTINLSVSNIDTVIGQVVFKPGE